MSDEKKIQELLRKIRLLKAKAEDPSVSEAEATAFAAKVAELLAAHGLEEAQLAVEEQTGIGHERYDGDAVKWNASPARRVLVIAICRLYMVKPLIRKKGSWTLIGRPHNIIMVKEMSEYLIKTTLRLSNAYGRAHPGSNVVDFRRGCFKRLAERLVELYYQQARTAAQYTPTGNPMNLPALYSNESSLTQQYMHRHFPGTGTMRPMRVKQGWDAAAGRAAGDNISLNRQVSGGNTRNGFLLGKK